MFLFPKLHQNKFHILFFHNVNIDIFLSDKEKVQ